MRAAALALLVASLIALVAGCSTTPPAPLGAWGYAFTLGNFDDRRADDAARMQAEEPFRIETFMQGWHANVGRSLFASQPARLDVVLHRHEATRNARSYALSMDVSLRGYDAYGRLIAATSGTCSVVMRRDMDSWAMMWGDFWQQPADQRGTAPLTLDVRDATMWQKVMNACVKDLATEFGNVLAAQAPR